jgi:hypothetical protein
LNVKQAESAVKRVCAIDQCLKEVATFRDNFLSAIRNAPLESDECFERREFVIGHCDDLRKAIEKLSQARGQVGDAMHELIELYNSQVEACESQYA